MAYQIFISYRRDGGEFPAKYIYDRLVSMNYRVFLDVESLRAGNFNKQLFDRIDECEIVIVVLPAGGLDRCLNDPEDWVRQEIAHALAAEKKMIPVLLRNFDFPEHLPEDIENIRNQEAVVEATAESFDEKIRKLVQLMEIEPDPAGWENQKKLVQIQERADAGDPVACNDLGVIYETGSFETVSIDPDFQYAYQYYEKAICYAGGNESAAAFFNIADIYERCAGNLSLVSDYGLTDLADQMIADMACVGETETAIGLRRSFLELAETYYEKATACGFAPADYKLGVLSEKNRQMARAFSYYQKAAGQGFMPAVNALAWMYSNGVGVERDGEKAKQLYEKAANAKDSCPEFIYNYARMLEPTDVPRATELYQSVAFGKGAVPMAAYALGRKYEYEYRDIRNAVRCYEEAVSKGIGEAQRDLDRCKSQWVR